MKLGQVGLLGWCLASLGTGTVGLGSGIQFFPPVLRSVNGHMVQSAMDRESILPV